jgi:hypothetical protein
VKAHSSGFVAHMHRCELAVDLDVRCLLLSLAVPQVPLVCGPGAAPQRQLPWGPTGSRDDLILKASRISSWCLPR